MVGYIEWIIGLIEEGCPFLVKILLLLLNSFPFIRSLVSFVEGEGLAYEWDHAC
jgi:hypothetical protein